jgi:hypothetical protein
MGVTKLCRKGLHDVTRPGARVWTGHNWTCRSCREAGRRDAQARYEGTLKGFLTKLRWHSGGAQSRLDDIDRGLE